MNLKSGKLPPDILKRLLCATRADPNVVLGPVYGEDAAAVKVRDGILVAAADPVTFASDRLGYYAVVVNANDVATRGVAPRYFLATILLPVGSTRFDAEAIFNQIRQTCESMGVALVGGHTELTPTVNCPVVAGCMLGECEPNTLITTSGAREGDAIIMTGFAGLEGTAILAREVPGDLTDAGVAEDVIRRAAALIDDPGICIVQHALIAARTGGVSAMHDPTEGGLYAAVWELASASCKGVRIEREKIPVLPETRALCDALSLDPLGLISSGSLLIAAPSNSGRLIVDALTREHIHAASIGTVVDQSQGVRFDDGVQIPLPERDEIARYFDLLDRHESP